MLPTFFRYLARDFRCLWRSLFLRKYNPNTLFLNLFRFVISNLSTSLYPIVNSPNLSRFHCDFVFPILSRFNCGAFFEISLQHNFSVTITLDLMGIIFSVQCLVLFSTIQSLFVHFRFKIWFQVSSISVHFVFNFLSSFFVSLSLQIHLFSIMWLLHAKLTVYRV